MADAIDHLVIAVADLEEATATLEQQVGLRCTAGGRHEGMGTANRIAFLADGSYVELMAVEDSAEAAGWPIGEATIRALNAGGGLAAYALLDEALPLTVPRLAASGSRVGPVVPGARRRDDGEVVRWWTAVIEPLGPDGLPFLIRHARYGVEWGPAALVARRDIDHPAGKPVGLIGLDLAVVDPDRLAATHLAALDLEYTAVVTAAVCAVGPHVIRLVPASTDRAPVTVRLRASGFPRTEDALGVRWVVSR